MTDIVAGRFEQQTDAQAAVERLLRHGFRRDDVSSFFVNPPGQHARFPVGGDRNVSPGARGAGVAAISGRGDRRRRWLGLRPRGVARFRARLDDRGRGRRRVPGRARRRSRSPAGPQDRSAHRRGRDRGAPRRHHGGGSHADGDQPRRGGARAAVLGRHRRRSCAGRLAPGSVGRLRSDPAARASHRGAENGRARNARCVTRSGSSAGAVGGYSSHSIGRVSRKSIQARCPAPVPGSTSYRTSPVGVRSIHSGQRPSAAMRAS